MDSQEFRELSVEAVRSLEAVSDEDWSRPALGLEWTCWQTVDHVIDCLFSYAFQVAARATSGFLPFDALHALPGATPDDLIRGLRGVVVTLTAVLDSAPEDTVASDGFLVLAPADWRARAAYELALHTHDVMSAFEGSFVVPADLVRSLTECETLWMLDREMARAAKDPWKGLLLGSGRRSTGTGNPPSNS